MNPGSMLVCILCCFAALATSTPRLRSTTMQGPSKQNVDPLEQRIDTVSLDNEYFIEGLARLNQKTDGLGFSIEFLPGTMNSPPHPIHDSQRE